MSRRKNRTFKEGLASELRGVADVLSEAELVRDPSPLQLAAGACHRGDFDGDQWEYECVGLVFLVEGDHLDQYKNTIPGTLQEIEIELTVCAKGRCWERYSNDDPFEKLEVDCKITARAQGVSYVCAWHLDRNRGDPENESRYFVHPCYHFQFGGRRLPRDLGYGCFLFVEPPRLAHPPLDAILAVDFVLTNYFPDTWHQLRLEDERYARIVQQAQHRCWRPYAEAIASGWKTGDPPWKAKSIWPQLILPT